MVVRAFEYQPQRKYEAEWRKRGRAPANEAQSSYLGEKKILHQLIVRAKV